MVVAAVNCVDNGAICQLYEVKGYPTFMYFKYQKEATNYNGGRKVCVKSNSSKQNPCG